MLSKSEEEKAMKGNVIQRLLCSLDICGLYCSMHTRGLNEAPNKEMTKSLPINGLNISRVNWKIIKYRVSISLNTIVAIFGFGVLLALGLMKFDQSPGLTHYCHSGSITGMDSDRKCWYDLLDRSIVMSWSIRDYFFMASGMLILLTAISSIIIIYRKKRDNLFLIGLLLICGFIHGAGLGTAQLRDIYDSGFIGPKEEQNLISTLRHSIDRINNNDSYSTHLKDSWTSIQENCECCGIFSSSDWKTIPSSCTDFAQNRKMCFDQYIGYNNYDNHKDLSEKDGCLGNIIKSVAKNFVVRRNDYFPFYVVVMFIIGAVIVIRACMFIPCHCNKKEKWFDREPLLLESSDTEILRA